MGDSFSKFYVCAHNRWNPYDPELYDVPDIYWVIQAQILSVMYSTKWNLEIKPHAELIGQLTHPEIYKVYAEEMEKRKKINAAGAGGEYVKEHRGGMEGGASANSHYDPTKGIVDENGNVLIPKEKFENMMGLDGVAISM